MLKNDIYKFTNPFFSLNYKMRSERCKNRFKIDSLFILTCCSTGIFVTLFVLILTKNLKYIYIDLSQTIDLSKSVLKLLN